MELEPINIGLAFLEGFALIISPCILPILPIILSGSLEGGKQRPFGIIIGFVLTFSLFTLFARQLVMYTGIDLTWARHVSYGLLVLFALIMLSDRLTATFAFLTERLTALGSRSKTLNNPQGGFLSGILFGALVGIIWAPCAGPILAAVIVQTVLQKTTLSSLLTVLFFGTGAGMPMLLIALFGRKIMHSFNFFRQHSIFLRKCLGGVILLTVAYVLFNEGAIGSPSFTPSYEQQNKVVDGVISPYPAPDFVGIRDWINSPPLHLNDLKGKVVLIDFWTYSCINCIRTLPYLKDWYKRYHDKGLVIVGIHSPEFAFEHDLHNVVQAVKQDEIHYPVGLDNLFATWQSYHNLYWPAHYLIDKNGYVVYQHFGEGEYAITENNIRYLLGLNKTHVTAKPEVHVYDQTPETYLGYERAERFVGMPTLQSNQVATYQFPAELADDKWALQGQWLVSAEHLTSAAAGATIKLHFNAGKIYAVMGNATPQPITVSILFNGQKPLKNGDMIIEKNTLYPVLALPQVTNGIVQLTASAPGLEMYTFTFGE